MTDLDRLTAWIDGYVRAWNTNDPADIGGLFSEGAAYFTAPYREPWRGRDEIVVGWLDRRDEPGDAAFEWQPLVVGEHLSVVQGVTRYATTTYSNLWLIRLGQDGRCREFTEWWMAQDD
jgi:hypothetical protein